MAQFMAKPERFTQVNDNFDQLGPLLINGIDRDRSLEIDRNITRTFLNAYTTSGQFVKEEWRNLMNLFTDVSYLAPIQSAVELMSSRMEDKIFYYKYLYCPTHVASASAIKPIEQLTFLFKVRR